MDFNSEGRIKAQNWWWVLIEHIKVNCLGMISVITFIPRLYVSPFSSFPPKTILLVFPVSPSSCILVTLCSPLSSDSLCFPSRHLGFCYAPICSSRAPSVRGTVARQEGNSFYGNMCTNPTEVNFKHLFFFPSVRQMSLTLSMHCLNTNAFPELDRKKLKYTSATVNEKWGVFWGDIFPEMMEISCENASINYECNMVVWCKEINRLKTAL